MPAFPENASLQETVDYVKTQLLAGHPEVIWQALPQNLRDEIDSESFRTELATLIDEQKQLGSGMEDVMLKVCEVLITKKDFFLNSQMMTMLPPTITPLIRQGYDPIAGLAYELSMMSINTEKLATMSMTDWSDEVGPRVGGHLQALLKLAPPGVVEGALANIQVQEQGDSGTISGTDQKGNPQTASMVRYEGRWIPQELHDKLTQHDGRLGEMLHELVVEAKKQNQANAEQATMMSGMVVSMAENTLQPLLDANTQAEFDQAMQQLSAMASMFAGGGPGGPPQGF